MQLACWAKFALEYETTCGPITNYKSGGVRNTAIPNFVYRWTEREVRKTIQSYAPETDIKTRFFYGLELNADFVASYSPVRARVLKLVSPIANLAHKAFPGQGNCFAFSIAKPSLPSELQPWLTMRGNEIVPNIEYAH
jgi:hypothetical protein